MRLWHRILITLVLAPLLWQLGAIYLGANTSGAEGALAASMTNLPIAYLVYTLPALAIVALLLIPADRLLALIGADLLIVAVAPLLALAVPVVLRLFVDSPRLDAAGLDGLAVLYGLVFGLTVREPARASTGTYA